MSEENKKCNCERLSFSVMIIAFIIVLETVIFGLDIRDMRDNINQLINGESVISNKLLEMLK